MTDVTVVLDERTAERLLELLPRLVALPQIERRERETLATLYHFLMEGFDTNELRERIKTV